MYEKAGYSCALLLVGYLSGKDIREKKIPVNVLIISLIVAVVYLAVGGKVSTDRFVQNMFPGMVLLLLSLLTKESIGYGDGMVVLLLGLFCGGIFAATAVAVALLLTGFYAVFLLICKNGQTIPFLPFLLTAMEVIFCYV